MKTTNARLERFTVSLLSGQIRSQQLMQQGIEFPRINETFDGKPYRYLYLTDPLDTPGKRPLYKIDTTTQITSEWSEEGCQPGEPIFVASPNGEKEDDGVILALILNTQKQSSFLLILDASSFKEIGRAKTSHKIPAGLHGQYFKT